MHCKSSRQNSSGFTLIEVVASLMLVGTLLVSVLMAHRRAVSQTRLAQNRLAAVEALDTLLAMRANPSDSEDLEQPTGKIPGDNPYFWRTDQRYDAAAEELGAIILTVSVFQPEYNDGETLASVEMLAPSGRELGGSDEQQ